MTIISYDAFNKINFSEKKIISNFLHKHLGKYGDDLSAIEKAMDYATKERPAFGGFILVAKKEKEIVGATVINKTGMDEYIPENILIYIATHKEYRGQGIGKKLMKKAIDKCRGNIALHVEHDNPAKHLYEKLGFENKYLEMRLIKD